MSAGARTLPQRGDIVFALVDPNETKGDEISKDTPRPWLVVSSDVINTKFEMVVAIPFSRHVEKKNRWHRIFIPAAEIMVENGPDGAPISGIAIDRVALTEQVRILAIERVTLPRVGRLSAAGMGAVEAGLSYVLGIP
jgi:mRNA-degrading endonuclease toxin of MazEF toxin-antitoxin module